MVEEMQTSTRRQQRARTTPANWRPISRTLAAAALCLGLGVGACSDEQSLPEPPSPGPPVTGEPTTDPENGDPDNGELDNGDETTGPESTDEPTDGAAGDHPATQPITVPGEASGELARAVYQRETEDGIPQTSMTALNQVDPDEDYAVRVECSADSGPAVVEVALLDATVDTEREDSLVVMTAECGILHEFSAFSLPEDVQTVQALFTEIDEIVVDAYAVVVPLEGIG